MKTIFLKKTTMVSCMLSFILLMQSCSNPATKISGKMKVWYPVTITFDGPEVAENESTFTNFRLDVTFTGPGYQQYEVPGYFAADGDAANTSATSGNKWRVKFTPDEAGTWAYSVSFRTGTNVAAGLEKNIGNGGTPPDGESGSFDIEPADVNAPGFYSKGMLRYVGEHYLQFQGNKEWFVKAGPGSPEDFFGYQDFDDTYDGPDGLSRDYGRADQYLYQDHGFGAGEGEGLHRYLFHVQDWQQGDPVWQNDKGKGIIGSINYLSNIGANSIYHILMTRGDDADNTWPWINRETKLIYDVSKLEQWAMVYEYMDSKGINADLYTCEADNDKYLNDGDMGLERSIYYRELIARLGFKLALRYNLGEEHGLSEEQMKANADYLFGLDPYGHPVGSHCSHKKPEHTAMYNSMLGYPNFHGAWMQLHDSYDIHNEIKSWIQKSDSAGQKWIVADDETWGISEDNISRAEEDIWAVMMAGGEGMNLYVAYHDSSYNDVSVEDFRRMHNTLRFMISARKLFSQTGVNKHLPHMTSSDNLVGNKAGVDAPFCYARPGKVYIVYSEKSNNIKLDLSSDLGNYTVKWWNPRETDGVGLQDGSVSSVTGGKICDPGYPPKDPEKSWALVLTNDTQNN